MHNQNQAGTVNNFEQPGVGRSCVHSVDRYDLRAAVTEPLLRMWHVFCRLMPNADTKKHIVYRVRLAQRVLLEACVHLPRTNGPADRGCLMLAVLSGKNCAGVNDFTEDSHHYSDVVDGIRFSWFAHSFSQEPDNFLHRHNDKERLPYEALLGFPTQTNVNFGIYRKLAV